MPIKGELSIFSLQDMLRCMMLQQTLILEKVKGKKQDHYHSQFDSRPAETCCYHCTSELSEDHDTRWSTKRPGFYVTRQGKCHSCNGKSRTRKPVDTNIAWIHGMLESMQREVSPEELRNCQPARRGDELWTTCMRKEKHPNFSFPEKVESWCIRCKENGKHSAGDGVWVDEEPR